MLVWSFNLCFSLLSLLSFYVLFCFMTFNYTYVGPVVGSFLYSVGGFSLPFYVIGGLTTGLSLALLFVVPNINKDSKEEEEEKDTLTHKHASMSKQMAEQQEKEEANKNRKPLSLMAVALVQVT